MIKFNSLTELYTAIQNDPERQKFDLSDNIVTYHEATPHAHNNSDGRFPTLMIIGEAPGRLEDERLQPFIGRSGQLLRDMINDAGFINNCYNIYITNFCKQRPPNNRNPYVSELSFYLPYILQEIELVNPALIITTGQVPYTALTGDIERISQIRGNITSIGEYHILPVFHPAYLLRQGSKSGGPRMLTKLDLIKARKFINERS